MPAKAPDFLTVPEIRRATGLGRPVERAIKSGDLPSYRFDAWRRVRRDDLRAWLERHRRPARSRERKP
jgi:excisionase family DNA binding protein